MLTVLCVYQPSKVYTEEYVLNLQAAVYYHINQPHIFACMSKKRIDGVCHVPLMNDWPGWWAKAELFRPDLGDLGRILYIDLDTLITGDISGFAVMSGTPVITKDFIHGGPSQSILNYEAGQFDHVWDAFTAEPDKWMEDGERMAAPHFGDQVLLTKNDHPFEFRYWQDLLPHQLVSYRLDCVKTNVVSELPPNARMVSFHGRDKPHSMGGWVRDYWQVGQRPLAGEMTWRRKQQRRRKHPRRQQ